MGVSIWAAADKKSLRSSDSGYTVQTDNSTVMLQALSLATQLMKYGHELANRQHKAVIGSVYE